MESPCTQDKLPFCSPTSSRQLRHRSGHHHRGHHHRATHRSPTHITGKETDMDGFNPEEDARSGLVIHRGGRARQAHDRTWRSAAALQRLRRGSAFPDDYACTSQEAMTTLHCTSSLADRTSPHRRPASPGTTSSRRCLASPRITFSQLSAILTLPRLHHK
jgi:hypothetical protein